MTGSGGGWRGWDCRGIKRTTEPVSVPLRNLVRILTDHWSKSGGSNQLSTRCRAKMYIHRAVPGYSFVCRNHWSLWHENAC